MSISLSMSDTSSRSLEVRVLLRALLFRAKADARHIGDRTCQAGRTQRLRHKGLRPQRPPRSHADSEVRDGPADLPGGLRPFRKAELQVVNLVLALVHQLEAPTRDHAVERLRQPVRTHVRTFRHDLV